MYESTQEHSKRTFSNAVFHTFKTYILNYAGLFFYHHSIFLKSRNLALYVSDLDKQNAYDNKLRKFKGIGDLSSLAKLSSKKQIVPY